MEAWVHLGSAITVSETAAFEHAVQSASTVPASVLYLGPSDLDKRAVEARWSAIGDPSQLAFASFDELVSDVHETQYYTTRAKALSGEERQRLVEAAVDGLDDSAHPLAAAALASAAACVQSEELLSLLEFAALTDPDAIVNDERLTQVPEVTRDALYTLSMSFETARQTLTENSPVYSTSDAELRSDRYQRVVADTTALSKTLAGTDVVVLSQFAYFSPLERELIDAITKVVPQIHAALPVVDATTPTASSQDSYAMAPVEDLAGIDRGAERAWRTYHELGFTVSPVDSDNNPQRTRLAHSLYRYAGTNPPAIISADSGVSVVEYTTSAHEIRGTARQIRQQLSEPGDIESLEDIGVILPSPQTYTRPVIETFEQYDLPVRATQELSLAETAVGSVIDTVLRLGAGERRVHEYVQLVTNPLVSPREFDDEVIDQLVAFDARTDTSDSEVFSDLLARTEEDGVPAVLELCTHLEEIAEDLWTSTSTAAGTVQDVLESLGVLTTEPQRGNQSRSWNLHERLIDGTARRTTRFIKQETTALRQLQSVVDSFVATTPVGETNPFGPRLRRAIESTTVDVKYGGTGGVELLSPSDATFRTFDRVYILGLTQENFPTNPRRLAFARTVNDAHPDFEPTDAVRQTRYALALQLVSADSITLSYPKVNADGDDTVHADFLAELLRVGSDPGDLLPASLSEHLEVPVSREEVQRRVARHFDVCRPTNSEADDVGTAERAAVDDVVAAGVFAAVAGDTETRLQDGLACSLARRRPETTQYDGKINPAVAQQFTVMSKPLSPSQVTTYAKCGFQFYGKYVLRSKQDDPITVDLDSAKTGKFVHSVLARFFRSLQQEVGEPVTLTDPDEYHDAMYDAFVAELDNPDLATADSSFYDGWLTQLAAGLTPTTRKNEYDGPSEYKGFLVRFLERTVDEQSWTTTRPAFFEVNVGIPTIDRDGEYSAPEMVLSSEPVDLVPESPFEFSGRIDRVDVVPGTDPLEATTVDYKRTSRSIRNVLDGIEFQLPLYLRLLEAGLEAHAEFDEIVPIGGAYFEIKPVKKAKMNQSPVASRLHTATASKKTLRPILRSSCDNLFDFYRDPPLERESGDLDLTRKESLESLDESNTLTTFLYETLDSRLTTISDAIHEGVYHTTLVKDSVAGCDYCEYKDICDVRHHQRQTRQDNHGLETVYLPDSVGEDADEEDDK